MLSMKLPIFVNCARTLIEMKFAFGFIAALLLCVMVLEVATPSTHVDLRTPQECANTVSCDTASSSDLNHSHTSPDSSTNPEDEFCGSFSHSHAGAYIAQSTFGTYSRATSKAARPVDDSLSLLGSEFDLLRPPII
jgi:hypothetical protein